MADTLALEIFGVYDRGIPNKERIVLRAYRPLVLTNYAIVLGNRAPGDTIRPFRDSYFWFGTIAMDVPGWLFLYTGKGTPAISQEQHTKEPIHTFYWNSTNVVLSDPNVIPAVFRMTDVSIGSNPNRTIEDLQKAAKEQSRTNDFLQELMRLQSANAGTSAQTDNLLKDLLKLSDQKKP